MPRAKAHILVVDDDRSASAALELLLRAEGFSVATAPDGVAALVESKRKVPDVVVTDLHMPLMDGAELCRRLRAVQPEVPVIVVTASADSGSAIECLRAGADDYLSKPLEVDALLHRIERTLERRSSKAALERLTLQMRLINERLILSCVREQENADGADNQRAQLNALLENLSEGVIIADGTGRIRMANRAAHAIWLGARGIADVHELNRIVTLRVDGTLCPADERPLTRALRGEVFAGYELGCIRADGEERRVVTSGTNVQGPDKAVALAIVIFSDVTELRLLERRRDEYVALISHDLRGPLNTIVMSAFLLKERNANLGDTPVIDRLARNAKRMSAMIAELLESTSLESEGVHLRTATYDLREIVSGIIDDLDDAGRRRVVFEASDATTSVLVDASKIIRAITNLLTNALKYSPADTAVRVALGHDKDNVVLEIADHGIGIAPAHLPRLFERYYRAPTDKPFVGLGLGLYITGLIVTAHGGRIEVVSELGEGTTFRLSLPQLGADA